MYRIKLKLIGRKKQAEYRIIVSKKKSGFTSGVLADIGYYKGCGKKIAVVDKKELIFWLEKGAVLSDRVSKIVSLGL